MENPDFRNNWELRWKEGVRKAYPNLTDDDLKYEIDREAELLERLQKKTGKTKKEIYEWLHLMG